jgi:hypothetical protein
VTDVSPITHKFAALEHGKNDVPTELIVIIDATFKFAPVSRKLRSDGIDRAAQSARTPVTPLRASIQ